MLLFDCSVQFGISFAAPRRPPAFRGYLQPDFEPVERRGARPGDAARDAAGHQVAPPHARHDLLLAEVVGDADVLAKVDALEGRENGEELKGGQSAVRRGCEARTGWTHVLLAISRNPTGQQRYRVTSPA